jgi:hypothetical protein
MGSVAHLKKSAVEQLLQQEDHILVVVDPTQPNVVLPEHLLSAGQPVGLNIGYRLALPIPDLELDEVGLRGTLSFNRTPFYCSLPWQSMVQVSVHDEHLIWLIPTEREASPPPPERPEERPRLRVLK